MKLIVNWILPVLIAAGIFLAVRPVLAQTVETPKNVSPGTESVDGYTQIFYDNDGQKQFITSGNISSHSPYSAGNFITYVSDINGQGQIFLYNLASGARTQLTFISTNLNPKVNNKGQVIWEGWSGETWQVFFFDGAATLQLTVGDTTLNPEFGGEYISYGRRNSAGSWRAVVYSTTDKKSVDVTTGEETRKPKIGRDGEILLGDGGQKFPLKASDLFLLDLPSINESTSSGNPILEELNSTPSGVVEIVTNL